MKKKIIVLVVLVLFAAAGGIFWWQKREVKGSPNDYMIKETAAGKIVENKRAGLSVKVPEGWEAERVEMQEGAVNFYSRKGEVERKEGKIILPIKKGCLIQTNVVYKDMNFEQIKNEAKYTHSILGSKAEEFEFITINDYQALKNTFDTQKNGPGIGIYIPKKNKGYAFYLRWSSDDRETCIQEFNKFLDTVSIR